MEVLHPVPNDSSAGEACGAPAEGILEKERNDLKEIKEDGRDEETPVLEVRERVLENDLVEDSKEDRFHSALLRPEVLKCFVVNATTFPTAS